MPLIVKGPVPPRWKEREASRLALLDSVTQSECLRLALINNMPDSALEDTELQFFELLDDASGDIPVLLKLYSMTGVPRAALGQRHLNSFYFGLGDLWLSRTDGMIVTGTEPHHPNLRDEPYWALMTQLFDWAERNTNSTILSCLAAHASVLHGDGIQRHPLAQKRFGVYESPVASDHGLMRNAASLLRFPHSRWNEVRENELIAAGYVVLTKSVEAGVDLFVKKKQKSLFVHFQGHPEYGAYTLAKEYRRDVKRFLRAERPSYPSLPDGYFDEAASQLLNSFRANALLDRREELMNAFPDEVIDRLQKTWQASAKCIYSNWLEYLVSARAEQPAFNSIAAAPAHTQRSQAAKAIGATFPSGS